MAKDDFNEQFGVGANEAEIDADYQERAVNDAIEERNRQHIKNIGGNTDLFDRGNSKNDWVSYICAYAGRASDKVHRNEREGCNFRENMVKVAALALAAIESHDKGWC
jgi:hypothetical protein